MRALLLPEPRLTGRPDTLLTPRLGFRERQKVALIRRGGESCVRLSRRASATAAYSRFEFRRIPRLEGSDAPGARFESFWNHI